MPLAFPVLFHWLLALKRPAPPCLFLPDSIRVRARTTLRNLRTMNILRILPVLLSLFWMGAGLAASKEIQDIQRSFQQGQLDPALKRVDDYLVGHPEDPEARFLKGLILVKKGDNAGAIGVFTALSRDYPELPEPYNNLAVLYAAEGHYEDARDALREAIRTHPSYATAHENLGDIYAKMASVAYDKALSLDKQNRVAQAKLELINNLFSISEDRLAMVNHAAAAAATEQPVAPVMLGADETVASEIMSWARAWSERNVEDYLSHYADDFVPEAGLSRGAWEALRRKRLTGPRFIEVEIQDIRVTPMDGGRVRSAFLQTYRSDTYSDRTTKVLILEPSGTGWKIAREKALP